MRSRELPPLRVFPSLDGGGDEDLCSPPPRLTEPVRLSPLGREAGASRVVLERPGRFTVELPVDVVPDWAGVDERAGLR